MNYGVDLLAEARRRAMLSGLPLSNQEMQGISNSAAMGAGERALAKRRLMLEKLAELRQQKTAKKAMAAQEKQQKVDAAGNALIVDQMTGGKGQGALLAGLRRGAGAMSDMVGATPYINAGANALSRGLGGLTGNILGNTQAGLYANAANTAGAEAIKNILSGATQTLAEKAALNTLTNTMSPAVGQLATQTGTQLAGTTAGTTAGNMAANAGANAAANAGANAGANLAGNTAGSTMGQIAGAVTPVLNIIGAADAARGIWGGDLDRPYDKAGWSQKIARTPLANTGVPGFGATEIEVSKAIGGKNNFVSKFQSKVNEEMSRLEEKIVGKPLDKIFKAVGKIFCHAAGTMFQMADGTTKAVEDIKIGDEMLEGGKVFAVGQCELNDLWSYKGARVSPEHAVLENGAWIRVKDSRRGKMIDSEAYEVVYPVCNENHAMIGADGTVWADFAETDQGTSVNDAERLAYMNSDTETIEYLEEKYGC